MRGRVRLLLQRTSKATKRAELALSFEHLRASWHGELFQKERLPSSLDYLKNETREGSVHVKDIDAQIVSVSLSLYVNGFALPQMAMLKTHLY